MRLRWIRSMGVATVVAVVAGALLSQPALASSYAGVVDGDNPAVFMPYEGSSSIDFPSGSCHLDSGTFTGATLVLGGGGSWTGAGNGCWVGGSSSTFTPGGLTTWSMEAWIESTTCASGSPFIAQAWSANGSNVGMFYNTGSGCNVIRYNGGDCAISNLPSSTPHYLAQTYDGSTVKLYVDGVVPATGQNNGPCQVSTSGLTMGAVCGVGVRAWYNNNVPDCNIANDGGNWCCNAQPPSTMSIGEIAWYGYTLTATQIANHYSARNGGPAQQFVVTAVPSTVRQGGTWQLRAQATDSGGADVTSSTTFTTSGAFKTSGADGTVLTCDGHSVTLNGTNTNAWSFTWSSSTISCHSSAPGSFTVDVNASTVPNTTVEVAATVGAPPGSFSVNPSVQSTQSGHGLVGQQVAYEGVSLDSNFSDVSATDSWVWSAVPAHVTCSTPQLGGNPLGAAGLHFFSSCSGDTVGSYTLTARDSYGFTATAYLVVDATPTSAACGNTDLGCWLNQVWNAIVQLAQIPGQIVSQLGRFLFVSASGKSFIDFSGIQVIPTIACRSGEAPTAPDGVHCLPFPFAIAAQLGQIFNTLNVAPTAPTLDLALPCGFGPNALCHHTVDPSVVLTTGVMTWVRGGEYVLFVASLGMAVRKYVQAFGVA